MWALIKSTQCYWEHSMLLLINSVWGEGESIHKEGWALKNWCLWTMVLEKTLESPLDCREIKPVNPKGNQPLILIGRIGAEASVLWPPDGKSQLIEKDPDAWKDWGQEEEGATKWDVLVAYLTQWTWIWANFRRWWRTGRAGVLQSMGSQRVRHDSVTEQQNPNFFVCYNWLFQPEMPMEGFS